MVDRLLLEKIPLAGIARVMQMSEDWLQRCVNQYYQSLALGLAVPGMPVGSLGMEAGDTQEPFTVFSFDQQGNAEVFNQYSS
jgi:hypothetical protein